MSDSEHDAETINEQADEERSAIRKQLSTLSFEELQKLKERMGTRVYEEAVFGETDRPNAGRNVFKRENKNRPREMSSKKPVSMIREVEGASKRKKMLRDPRFDPLCGEFDKKTFKESYAFLDEVRARDATTLGAELKECEDPERRATIRLLLQRLKNQAREEDNNRKKRNRRREEKKDMLQSLKEGKKEFASKSEKRVKDLVEQYEDLRQSGKLQKHIERRLKKVTQKARKRQLAPPV